MSAATPKGKRLEGSAQTSVDQTENRAKPAADTRNRAQLARQMPEPRLSVEKCLDRSTNNGEIDEKVFHLGNVGSSEPGPFPVGSLGNRFYHFGFFQHHKGPLP
jgi:hypothetical protein